MASAEVSLPADSGVADSVATHATQSVHQLKELAQRDPSFAAALLATKSTQETVELAQAKGITVTPEALWRNRGTLMSGGLPTWRG